MDRRRFHLPPGAEAEYEEGSSRLDGLIERMELSMWDDRLNIQIEPGPPPPDMIDRAVAFLEREGWRCVPPGGDAA